MSKATFIFKATAFDALLIISSFSVKPFIGMSITSFHRGIVDSLIFALSFVVVISQKGRYSITQNYDTKKNVFKMMKYNTYVWE